MEGDGGDALLFKKTSSGLCPFFSFPHLSIRSHYVRDRKIFINIIQKIPNCNSFQKSDNLL